MSDPARLSSGVSASASLTGLSSNEQKRQAKAFGREASSIDKNEMSCSAAPEGTPAPKSGIAANNLLLRFSKMGTELTTPDNPYAQRKHSGNPLLDGKVLSVPEGFEYVTLAPENAILQKKILLTAILNTDEAIKQYNKSPSDQNLPKIFNHIQSCYLKCWQMQDVLQRWLDPPQKFNPDQLISAMANFENRIVDFLVICTPVEQKHNQDLFLMSVWYLTCKCARNEEQSANDLMVRRRAANLFSGQSIIPITSDTAKARITKFNIQKESLDETIDNTLPDCIFSVLRNLLFVSSSNTHQQTIMLNIEKLVTDSPIFKNNIEKFRDQLEKAKQKTNSISLSVDNGLKHDSPLEHHQNSPSSIDTHQLSKCIISCIGFSPYSPSSPDLALVALQRLYQYRSMARPEIEYYVRIFNDAEDKHYQAFFSLYKFLLDGSRCFDEITNDDLKHYVESIVFYLRNQRDQAEECTKKSRSPEAGWLRGKIQHEQGCLAEAIENTQKAIALGLESAKRQLVTWLLKSPEFDRVTVHKLLDDIKKHYQFINREDLVEQVEYTIDELKLDDETLSLPAPLPAKKKSNRKKRGHQTPSTSASACSYDGDKATSNKTLKRKEEQKQFDSKETVESDKTLKTPVTGDHSKSRTKVITKHEVALLNIEVTHALACQDYDHAHELVENASQKVNWDFQQATIGRMDLWRLRELANDTPYLELLIQSLKKDNKVQEFNTINQHSPILTEYGLDQREDEAVILTEDIDQTKKAIRDLVINKTLSWLCFLHPDEQDLNTLRDQWRDTPKNMVKTLMKDYQHSLSMTFTTASFLSMLGHIHSDLSNSSASKKASKAIRKEMNILKEKSRQFYDAANEFNKWRNRLKSERTLSRQIAEATPLGNLQRIRKQQKPTT